jgi:hypothetical protein
LNTRKYLLCIIAVLSFFQAFSQQDLSAVEPRQMLVDNSKGIKVDSSKQKDLIDVFEKILNKTTSLQKRQVAAKTNFSIIPYGGYTLSTGFVVDMSGNVAFYTSANHQQNYSVATADLSYDSKTQKVFFTRSEIWTNNNNYKVVSDLRFESYPTETYGLGTSTTFATDDHIDYYYVRIYETVLKKINNNYYTGIGYNFDHYYDITGTGNPGNTVSDFEKYGQTKKSTSSGINLDFLYDSRKNPLNSIGGAFASVIFRENTTLLGSDANWQSLKFDFRKYFKVSSNSNNVFAVWSIVQFTSGNAPYLDLPTTGGDMYNNSGRGYAVGRFRGKNELYLEGEYRFGLTKNGLLGAVIFANGESFSELQSNAFEKVAPAAGTGIRIKLNKHSNSNIAIDYGIGTGGSQGFFVNLGEVF